MASKHFSIAVHAGMHDRGGVPIAVDLPITCEELQTLGRPLLLRSNRSRAVPCQSTAEHDRVRLWWILSGLKAGETAEYELTFGLRKRNPPNRMTIRTTPTGRTIECSQVPLAEFFLPKRGSPRLALCAAEEPIARIEHHARPNWSEDATLAGGSVPDDRTLHRIRATEPVTRDGVVLASVQAAYDYLDTFDRAVFSETHTVHFFPPDAAVGVIDYAVTWQATARGLAILDPDRNADQRLPELNLRVSKSFGDEITRAVGAIGYRECRDAHTADVAFRAGTGWLGVLAQPESRGAPVVMAIPAEDSIRSSIAFAPAQWIPTPIRLAIGETLEFQFRLVRFKDALWSELYPRLAFPAEIDVKPH